MNETEFTEPDEKEKVASKHHFFNWQCVSLVRANGTTFDLIVRDSSELMTLINVVQ